MNIAELMDQAKKAHNIASDLQLSKKLGVSHATLWHWRQGNSLPNIEHAQALAQLAGIDPAKAVAEVLIEGTDNPALIKTLRRFLAVAVTTIVCILCKMFPAQCRLTPHHKPFIFQPLPN